MEKNTAELFVKIISILGYIWSGICILAGLLMIFAGPLILKLLSAFLPQALVGILTGVIVLGGIFILVIGCFGIFLYHGLMNYKEWARITVIIFSALGVLSGLTSLPSGLIELVYSGLVLYLLAFDKTAIKLFRK